MRRRAAQALVLLHSHSQQQSLQQVAAQAAALHAGCLSVPSSSATTSQQEQAVLPAAAQQSRQSNALGLAQDYHAAALARPVCHTEQQFQPHHQQPWHAASQPVQQQIHRAAAPGLPSNHASSHLGQLQPAASSAGTSLTSQTVQQSSASAAAVDDDEVLQQYDQPYGPTGDVFELSSAEQQYKTTVAALRIGQSKNLDQLAYMFDPQAVLAAPDKGAAVFEALMFAAAKLQDLQLLRQLLRCTAAAGNALSSSGHRAVLHGLASCGRPVEALDWLQKRVPEQLLTPQLMRSLVQQLLNKQHIQAAQRALDYAEPKLLQRWQQELQGVSPAAASAGPGPAAEAGLGPGEQPVPQLLLQDMQELPSLRLLVAGKMGTWTAVQEQWQAVQEQAQALQPWLQSQQDSSSSTASAAMQQADTQQLALLGASVWSNYTTALGRAAKQDRDGWLQKQARQQMHAAALQTLDRYHESAWASYIHWQASRISQLHPQDQQQQLAALAAQQQVARQLWQHQLQAAATCSWQELDAAQTMPQQVSQAADKKEQQLCRRAVQDAMYAAAGVQDMQQVQQLLKLGSLLKISPRVFSFEVLLQLQLRQGAPPEALEELLSEIMGFGAIPSVTAYEAVMEAYALHQDGAAAEAVLDRMQAAGLQPVLRTYNRLLHGLAMNGNLAVAIRVYNRLRLQGLQPDQQTFRAAFKCARMYASNVRVTTARTISLAKPGDRDTILSLLSQRAALFASAYSQLASWQRDMVASGLKHSNSMMMHLTQALERLGALQDCLQLARLSEDARPGDFKAHRAALRAAGRARDAGTAAEVSKLIAKLAEGQGLQRQDYLCIINSQFWLEQDHEKLLQTVAAMKAAGHELDAHVLQHLLHVYCHSGMWGEALQVLSDVAAGRLGHSSSSTAASDSKQQLSTGVRQHAKAASDDSGTIDNDRLWHVVLRKLWEKRASDELLNEFLQHMAPSQVMRFKLMYGLHAIPGEQGRYTLRPLEDWQLPAQLQAQLQQQRQQQQQQLDAPEQLKKLQDAHTEPLPVSA